MSTLCTDNSSIQFTHKKTINTKGKLEAVGQELSLQIIGDKFCVLKFPSTLSLLFILLFLFWIKCKCSAL